MSTAGHPSEAEKTLRYLLGVLGGDIGLIARPRKAAIAMNALGALLAEHEREVSAARDAALEEVAKTAESRSALARQVYKGHPLEQMGNGAADALATLAADIRVDMASPGKRWLDADEVAEVLKQAMGTGGAREPVLWAMGRLGLALPQGPKPCTLHPECIQSAGHNSPCEPPEAPEPDAAPAPAVIEAECPACHQPLSRHTSDGRYVRQPGTGLVCFHAHSAGRPRDPMCPECPPVVEAPPPPAESTVWRKCPTPSCVFGKDHEGDCSPEEEPEPPPTPAPTVADLCPNPSCMKDKGHKEPCDPLDED